MLHGLDFRTPNKHVTHYGPRSGFPYPYPQTVDTMIKSVD
jgi:hypothetical protein